MRQRVNLHQKLVQVSEPVCVAQFGVEKVAVTAFQVSVDGAHLLPADAAKITTMCLGVDCSGVEIELLRLVHAVSMKITWEAFVGVVLVDSPLSVAFELNGDCK